MWTQEVADSDAGRIPEAIAVGDARLPTWPESQSMQILGEARVVITHFADAPLYHAPLREAALAALDNPRFFDGKNAQGRYACGRKVRDLAQWGVPAASLVHARALAFAHRVSGLGPIYASDSWGSIYGDGDYCIAHSHVYADISIVYMLEPGDPDPNDPMSGKLAFMDTRIPWCCPHEPDRATRPLVPDMAPGSMVAFVSEMIHLVNPYRGQRPRITMSWNLRKNRPTGPIRPEVASTA